VKPTMSANRMLWRREREREAFQSKQVIYSRVYEGGERKKVIGCQISSQDFFVNAIEEARASSQFQRSLTIMCFSYRKPIKHSN